MATAHCGKVKLVRTMKGEASVMLEVAAAMTTMGVLDWVAMGAVAKAKGVRPKPLSTPTLSFTTSSCAMRLVASGTPPSSLMMSSILRPATVLPFCAMNKRAAASICLPVDADCPVMGNMSPILKASCAHPELALNNKAKPIKGNKKRVFMKKLRGMTGAIDRK